MRTDPVRIGIIGCGSVSRVYIEQIRQLVKEGKARLVMACDTVEDLREKVREDWGVNVFTREAEELLRSPDVDLALVLTPMPSHGSLARRALEEGKHVMVEKPLATTLEEAGELVETAKRSPGYLVPAPHVVLSPTFRAMRERIRRGDIGRPLTARARYGWAGPTWGQWFYRAGGGVLFDLGVYNLTSLTGLLGPAKRVMAMTGTAIPERVVDGAPMRVEVEDNAHILLDFGESVFAVVTTGFTMQQYRGPCIEVYGSEGTLQMLGDDWQPGGYEIWRNAVGGWQIVPESAPNWSWTDGLRHLVECIRQGIRPEVTPEHAYHVLEIMLRALESGRDGQARTLESRFPRPE